MNGAMACARSSGQVSCSYHVQSSTCIRKTCAGQPPSSQPRAGNVRRYVLPYSQAFNSRLQRQQTSCRAIPEHGESEESASVDILKPVLLLGSTLSLLIGCHPALAESTSQSPHYHPVAASIQDIASNEDFWENLLRYARFFLSVLVGTAYTALKPVGGLLRRPVTAILVVGILVGGYLVLNATLKSMLGVEVQEPLPLFN